MAYKSMFSRAQIESMLPDIIDILCPFKLTQYSVRYDIYHEPSMKNEIGVRGHRNFPFSSLATWLERGDLINGRTFDDWYAESLAMNVGVDDVEALL